MPPPEPRKPQVTVHAEPAVLILPVLFAAQYLWLVDATVAAAVVFTAALVAVHASHEAAHAFTAVRFGENATVRFTAFGGHVDHPQTLSWKRTAVIAAAGPAAGIGVSTGLIILGIVAGVTPVRTAGLFGLGLSCLDLIPFAPMDGYQIVRSCSEHWSTRPDRTVRNVGRWWLAALGGVWVAAVATAARPLLIVAALATLMTAIIVVGQRFKSFDG